MMDMRSKNQYLKTLIQKHGYHARSKKEKSMILDEYCERKFENSSRTNLELTQLLVRKVLAKGEVLTLNFVKRKVLAKGEVLILT